MRMDIEKIKTGLIRFFTSKWIKGLGILILAVILLFLFIDRVFMPLVVRLGQESDVPDLQGLRLDEAKSALKERGLELRVIREEYSLKSSPGTIISQFPEPGSRVKKGRRIRVVLSKGGEKATVPELTGMTLRQAELTLEARGLLIGEPIYISTDTLPAGEVINSFPAAGTTVPLDIEVRVLINQADTLEIVKVPQLRGENIKEVSAKLEELGLRMGRVRYRVKNHLLPGTVLDQIPKEGAEVKRGSIVELEVSTTD
jgi:beta-lactam-binding protein with PASTA domain